LNRLKRQTIPARLIISESTGLYRQERQQGSFRAFMPPPETPAPRRAFLTVVPEQDAGVVRGITSPVRLDILRTPRQSGLLNVNGIAEALGLPQSTVAMNIQVLEEADLVQTEALKVSKGQQKLCSVRFDEIVIRLDGSPVRKQPDVVEVAMPIGL
jgi:predicted transcriptional regulator